MALFDWYIGGGKTLRAGPPGTRKREINSERDFVKAISEAKALIMSAFDAVPRLKGRMSIDDEIAKWIMNALSDAHANLSEAQGVGPGDRLQ